MTEHHYQWRGHDRQGRPVKGQMLASHKDDVQARLRQQRIRSTRIQRSVTLPNWLHLKRQQRVKPRDVTRLTRQLATLLHAGVPLLQALLILRRGESEDATQAMLLDLQTQVEAGAALHQALQRHRVFDALYCNLVAVGEMAGMLDLMLERLAIHLEKTEALRATLRSALIYPCAVLTVAALVLVMILIFVVPAFQTTFAAFGAELPWLTRMVIGLSESVQHHGLSAIAVIVAAGLWLQRQMAHHATWRLKAHRAVLRLPIAGPLARHACTARWTRTLATLFAAGVPLTEALASMPDVTGNLLFQSATTTIQSQLMQGASLSQTLADYSDLFPPMAVQMCAIGEESGALEHMLAKTAEHYEREVDHTVMRLSTLLEPFIMVVLGLLIGGLVMALYLPIFQLGQVI